MANEYSGALYATILPSSQTNVVDNVMRLQQQNQAIARQQVLYAQRLAEADEKQKTGLLKYVNSYTGGLIKKVDSKNPYATLISTGIHDVQQQVMAGIQDGSLDDATAVSTINDGLDKWNQLATNWQTGESKLQGDAARLSAMGRNPQEKKAIADAFLTYGRKKLFFKDDGTTPDIEKTIQVDPNTDFAQDFLVNHPDLLPNVGGQFSANDYKTYPSATEDVTSNGKLLQATTAFRLVPGIQEAYRDDKGKLKVRYVGETPLVDHSTGEPIYEDVTKTDKDGSFAATKNGKPLMGISEEQAAYILQQKPYLVRDINLAAKHVNDDRKAQGQPPLTDDQAMLFKQAYLYKILPPVEQPITGSKDLSARSNLAFQRAAALKRMGAELQIYVANSGAAADKKLRDQTITTVYGTAAKNYASDLKEIDDLQGKRIKTADDDTRIAELQQKTAGGVYEYVPEVAATVPGVIIQFPGQKNVPAAAPVAPKPVTKPKTFLQNLFGPKQPTTPAPGQKTILKGTVR